MKRWFLIFFISILVTTFVDAQKINLKKWVSYTIDSLQKNHIDSIEYYHSYCGECWVTRKSTDTLQMHQCEVENSWTQITNKIIYKQNGAYYSLTFNCGYPPIKKELNSVKSLDYFRYIIPILTKRDKYAKALQRKHKFNPPIIVDGGYEEASLYYNGIKGIIYMQEDQKTNKAWRAYFWIDKQTKLFSLLESETSTKNQLPL